MVVADDVVISAFFDTIVSLCCDSVLNVTDLALSEGHACHHILLLLFAIVALADGSDAVMLTACFPVLQLCHIVKVLDV